MDASVRGKSATKRVVMICLAIVVAMALFASMFITILVIQPIGAVPDGRTLIISRLTKMKFVDSADAFCEREMGGVSLLCRSMAMGKIANEANIYLRLPYSETLYSLSTGGKQYDR